MKKLLAVLMVLIIVVGSQAATVSLDPSGIVEGPAGEYSIDVVSDSADFNYEYFLVINDSTYGSIADVQKFAAAGDDAEQGNLGSLAGQDQVWKVNGLDTSPGDGGTLAGVHFTATINYTGTAASEQLMVQLTDANLDELDSATYQVPEPLTIGLLGLGGLFVRRRKA